MNQNEELEYKKNILKLALFVGELMIKMELKHLGLKTVSLEYAGQEGFIM